MSMRDTSSYMKFRALKQGSFHTYLYGLFPDTWTVWEMWGVGWVGHLMPSNEREVEDTLKYFKPNNYFHLSHLQSNIKSLNFTEYSKLVSIWISRLVKKKSNKKYITGTVGKVLNNSILSMLSFLSVIILVCYVEENLCSKETPANC